jgi:3-oxoacyl-[acyl-carrier protein] reductase
VGAEASYANGEAVNLGIAGKSALVTAASRGIGRACALALAAEGARVAVCARSGPELDALVEAMGGAERGHRAIVADLIAADGPARAIDAVLAAGSPCEIVVHNLGGTFGVRDPFGPLAGWRAVWRANLEVAVELNAALVPPMQRAGWGRVVAITSVAGSEHQGALAYASAKAGLNAYVRGLAREVIADGVVVSAVSPGTVVTEGGVWEQRLRTDPAATAAYIAEKLPAGRFSAPEAIAGVVAFLCSVQAADCAGTIVAVDAGQGRAFGAPR